MTTVVVVSEGDVLPEGVAQLVAAHDLDSVLLHTDLQVAGCACRTVSRRPNSTGDVCTDCGGMMVRTGSCTTCVECATTGGCG